MKVRGNRRIAIIFMLVAMLSLAAAIIPLIKGRAVSVTFLGGAIVWLVISIVVGRGSGADANPPRA